MRECHSEIVDVHIQRFERGASDGYFLGIRADYVGYAARFAGKGFIAVVSDHRIGCGTCPYEQFDLPYDSQPGLFSLVLRTLEIEVADTVKLFQYRFIHGFLAGPLLDFDAGDGISVSRELLETARDDRFVDKRSELIGIIDILILFCDSEYGGFRGVETGFEEPFAATGRKGLSVVGIVSADDLSGFPILVLDIRTQTTHVDRIIIQKFQLAV